MCTHHFMYILRMYLIHVLIKKVNKPNYRFPQNAWFDHECKQLKSELHSMYRQIRSVHSTSHAQHDNIIKLERDYKRTIQGKKREHRENVLRHLEDLDSNDPTEYWRFWKSLQNRTTQSDVIDASTFAGHYKANNSPPIYPDFDYANINEMRNFIFNWWYGHRWHIQWHPECTHIQKLNT